MTDEVIQSEEATVLFKEMLEKAVGEPVVGADDKIAEGSMEKVNGTTRDRTHDQDKSTAEKGSSGTRQNAEITSTSKETTSIDDAVTETNKNETEQDSSQHNPEDNSAHGERDWRERRDADRRREIRERGQRAGRSRGGSQHYQTRDYKKNIKSDFSSLPESSDPDEIRKQVEFYFSDSNLPTDKFLLSQVGGSENKPVPIKVIHSFKRMRHFQPYSAVVEALRGSEVLEVVDERDGEEIRRKTPLPDAVNTENVHANIELFEDKARSRSIYAKGFGLETTSTQFDIEAFFAPYGPTNAIRLRRKDDKTFKGSVFVEFDSDETAAAFLELDPKPKWDGKELQIMSKETYVKGKADDIASSKIRRPQRGGRGGRGWVDRGERRAGRDKDSKDGRDSKDDHNRNGDGRSRGRGRGRGRGKDTHGRSDDKQENDRKMDRDSEHDDEEEKSKKRINDSDDKPASKSEEQVLQSNQPGEASVLENTAGPPAIAGAVPGDAALEIQTAAASDHLTATESKKRSAPTSDTADIPEAKKPRKTIVVEQTEP